MVCFISHSQYVFIVATRQEGGRNNKERSNYRKFAHKTWVTNWHDIKKDFSRLFHLNRTLFPLKLESKIKMLKI